MNRDHENSAVQSRSYALIALLIALLVIGCGGSDSNLRTTATTGALTVGSDGSTGHTTGPLTMGTNATIDPVSAGGAAIQ